MASGLEAKNRSEDEVRVRADIEFARGRQSPVPSLPIGCWAAEGRGFFVDSRWV